MQENQPAPVEQPKKQLKMQWTCVECTFLNTDQSSVCVMCTMPAPANAYAKEEEIEKETQQETPSLPEPVETT